MFERLIKSFGRPANQGNGTVIHDHELQLASAMLLFGALPVDYKVTSDETSAHARETSIVAATTLLKHRTSEKFRRQLLAEINAVMRADGVLHDNEIDLERRIERLLGLVPEPLQQTA
jgi:uncharacterized tellurite resistance protein B-like protein